MTTGRARSRLQIKGSDISSRLIGSVKPPPTAEVAARWGHSVLRNCRKAGVSGKASRYRDMVLVISGDPVIEPYGRHDFGARWRRGAETELGDEHVAGYIPAHNCGPTCFYDRFRSGFALGGRGCYAEPRLRTLLCGSALE